MGRRQATRDGARAIPDRTGSLRPAQPSAAASGDALRRRSAVASRPTARRSARRSAPRCGPRPACARRRGAEQCGRRRRVRDATVSPAPGSHGDRSQAQTRPGVDVATPARTPVTGRPAADASGLPMRRQSDRSAPSAASRSPFAACVATASTGARVDRCIASLIARTSLESALRRGRASGRSRAWSDEVDDRCIGVPGGTRPDADRVQLRDIHVGMMPPITTSTSSSPFSVSSSITRGQMCMCAPDRIDSPITSASSCSAALTICSGVCRRPV